MPERFQVLQLPWTCMHSWLHTLNSSTCNPHSVATPRAATDFRMPTWGEVLTELQDPANRQNGLPDFDKVRRKYLAELHALTGRATIIYYADWFNKQGPSGAINLEDMQGMMEVCRGLEGSSLDILIHSPGGQAEALAQIVRYLRDRYSNIRVFVPLAAMSAATMWALAADEIVMGSHSQLGPIDPQLIINGTASPARAILKQFDQAKRECTQNPAVLAAWAPILQQYGPALLQQCEAAEALAKGLVQEWLERYMFRQRRNKSALAIRVADYFSDHDQHLSHALGIGREAARKHGLVVKDLEDNQDLQEAVLSVHHATMHTLVGPAMKIIENHKGNTFAKLVPSPIVGLQLPAHVPNAPSRPT